MAKKNLLVDFLRHYGPIVVNDNMYDELIQSEIARYGVSPPIQIAPACLSELIENFQSKNPTNVILTGTAGDGKTYHCRRVWEELGGDHEIWQRGSKVLDIFLPKATKRLVIIKDLSEMKAQEKHDLIPGLASALAHASDESLFLVAANDGQLIATMRDYAEDEGDDAFAIFKTLEEMLVENQKRHHQLNLQLYNLSRYDAARNFDALIEQMVEHPNWVECAGCELLGGDGSTTCPIRLNRALLRNKDGASVFRIRLGQLLQLASANRMHLPIRDLLLLGVNVLLGDQQPNQTLLTCRTAKNRARQSHYNKTNPYANVFGVNLSSKARRKYQTFTVLGAFGIGRETDNNFDNLLIYGPYDDKERYASLIESDAYYGASAYRLYLKDYLEGERDSTSEFMAALERQRQRLFFSLPSDSAFDPWRLSVYRSAGRLLEFAQRINAGKDVSELVELLVRGLNRTFCGMMIDTGTEVYLTSSGGDGRGRIASILDYTLHTKAHRRLPYVKFGVADDDHLTSRLLVVDPTEPESDQTAPSLDLQLTHFEYLIRVASGSLPASFSRQCYEDFLDFKLRLIEHLHPLLGEETQGQEVVLRAITIDQSGRALPEEIRIRMDLQ